MMQRILLPTGFFVGDLLRVGGAAAAAAPDGLNGLIGHGNFPPVIG